MLNFLIFGALAISRISAIAQPTQQPTLQPNTLTQHTQQPTLQPNALTQPTHQSADQSANSSTFQLENSPNNVNYPNSFQVELWSEVFSTNLPDKQSTINNTADANINNLTTATSDQNSFNYLNIYYKPSKKIHLQAQLNFADLEKSFYFFNRFEKSLNTNSVQFNYGRLISLSQRNDSFFGYGLNNPVGSSDQMHFQEQGLIGAEHVQAQNWMNHPIKTYIGVYPFFVPQTRPGLQIKNGKAFTQSKWSQQPPELVQFNNQTKNINYNLKDVNYGQIVLSPATRIALENEYAFIYYKRGPLSDVSFERETYANLQLEGVVNISPRTVYSQTLGLEATLFKTNNLNFIYGLTYDQPDSVTPINTNYTISQFAPLTLQSISVDVELTDTSLNTHIVQFGLAQTYGGQIKDLNPNGEGSDIQLSNYRQKYFSPAKISILSQFSQWASQILYVRELGFEAELIDASATYHVNSATDVKLGLTVLGSQDANLSQDRNEKIKSSFINQHLSDDRIYSGLTYAF